MGGDETDRIQNVNLRERISEPVTYTDGSRIGGVTAACTRTEFIYLAKYPIVMNTEPLAIGMGCQKSKGVDSDSKGAGIRLSNLRFEVVDRTESDASKERT